ncbi:MAG TPA: DUF1772 domain-containing protein [Candidatus Dormibacteraeota bacterium]|nr:DUF1772 domain-containing protein [Candidatus Dormibacteraeota bacterium]
MNAAEILGFANLFLAGILAGEEFVIRFGVRGPIASLDQEPHIRVRQAVIRSLRVVVPTIYFATLLSGIAVIIPGGFGLAFGFRLAAILALLVWILVTLGGTVPINSAALGWDPTAPPANWRTMVSRWERLDTVRAWAAMLAFALLVIAMALAVGD